MASYVLYGFDTAGTLAEETDQPRRRAPRAILQALAAAGLAGALLIVSAILAVSDPARPELGPDRRRPADDRQGGARARRWAGCSWPTWPSPSSSAPWPSTPARSGWSSPWRGTTTCRSPGRSATSRGGRRRRRCPAAPGRRAGRGAPGRQHQLAARDRDPGVGGGRLGRTWPTCSSRCRCWSRRLRRRRTAGAPRRRPGGGRLFSMGRLGPAGQRDGGRLGRLVVINIGWPRAGDLRRRTAGAGSRPRWRPGACSPPAGSITRLVQRRRIRGTMPSTAPESPRPTGRRPASAADRGPTGSAASRPMNKGTASRGPFLVSCPAGREAGESPASNRTERRWSSFRCGGVAGRRPPRERRPPGPSEGPGLVRPRLHGPGPGGRRR